jgi:ABC-type branched-subunit amino acid transport system ATPase component/sugar phosphate permease
MTDALHQAEQVVDEIGRTQERFRSRARRTLGFDPGDATVPPLRSVLGDTCGWSPLVAVALLGGAAELQLVVNAVGPDISQSLGIGKAAISGMAVLRALALMGASLPFAGVVQHRLRRPSVALAAGVLWAAALALGSVALTGGVLALAVALGGLATGAALAVHTPLLADAHPIEARVRTLAVYSAARAAGTALVAVVVILTAAALGLTWRGALLGAALVTLVLTAVARRLPEPGFGRHDAGPVRDEVWRDAGEEREKDDEPPLDLSLFESLRRVTAAPTIRRVLVVNALLGMMFFPLQSYVFFHLEERWDVGVAGRGVFGVALFATVAAAVVALGSTGERRHRLGPGRLAEGAAWLLAAVVPCLVLAVVAPLLVIAFVGFAAALVALTAVQPALLAVAFAVVPPRLRGHVAALSGIFFVGVGGIAGVLLLGGIDRRYGLATAIVLLGVPALVGALFLRQVVADVDLDLDRTIDELVEREEIAIFQRQGRHLPMLSCRHLDFSYGQLQILFGVDFTVDDGEMVALLGTNGAGKSTLLRVISGLGLPSRGSVTFRGGDITFLDPERRVGLGITEIPGGTATFPPLSVTENLRVYGHSLGRGSREVDRGIEATFDAFPAIAERRNQLAASLSGGEQQMLALGKAFIVKPRLLLIDELSLGLAPKVVGELLEMVRRINADGTAVVLVEQSVNIALSLVDHAYFMEKGEIRFDGPARDLLERRDLLRSVFLEGASSGVSAPRTSAGASRRKR